MTGNVTTVVSQDHLDVTIIAHHIDWANERHTTSAVHVRSIMRLLKKVRRRRHRETAEAIHKPVLTSEPVERLSYRLTTMILIY